MNYCEFCKYDQSREKCASCYAFGDDRPPFYFKPKSAHESIKEYLGNEFKIDKDEAIELAHKAAEASGMSFEEFCERQSDNKQTVLNNNIQTCYRYLDFIEEFLDNYDEEVGLASCKVNYEEALWQVRYTLHHIIKETR